MVCFDEDTGFIKPPGAECFSDRFWGRLLLQGCSETWQQLSGFTAPDWEGNWDVISGLGFGGNVKRGRTGALQSVYFVTPGAYHWHPRKLRQHSHVVIENVSAKTGNGAGFLVKGDADISVPNSEHSSLQTARVLC